MHMQEKRFTPFRQTMETERANEREKIVKLQVNSIVDELFAASVHRLSAAAACIRKVNSSVRTLARICNLRFV